MAQGPGSVSSRATSSRGPLDAAERRRYARRAVPGIEGTLLSPGDVRVLDVSLTGFAAELPAELHRGDHCFLELHHHRGSEHHAATVEAVVRWTAVRVEREAQRLLPRFRAGLSFVDIDREGSGGIWDCILTEAEA